MTERGDEKQLRENCGVDGDNSPSDRSLELLSEAQLAEILQVSRRKLESDRNRGIGIPFVKFGRRVRYRRSDVQAFLRSHLFKSTAEVRKRKICRR